MFKNLIFLTIVAVMLALNPSSGLGAGKDADLRLDRIQLPPGFEITVYAGQVPNARGMTRSPQGTIYVGTRNKGDVYALTDTDGDYKADQVQVIASNLNMPVGVEYYKGDLYISAVSRILKIEDIENHLDDPPKPLIINDSFPTDMSHGWKYIRVGPDEKLYVPVGAPCNICLSDDERYASIMRMKPDGSELEVFAHGVRNTVGFDWDPATDELWFTDNGRDWLGDNSPPDELNHAPRADMHFGYPFCHAGTVSDPDFGHMEPCEAFTPPQQALGPHVAALGMKFYRGTAFPEEYRRSIYIAEHGSWNRSRKIGYRIMRVPVRDHQAAGYEVFAEGWLQRDKAWGRPVDLLELDDGSLLISDDHAGVIYRIAFSGKASKPESGK